LNVNTAFEAVELPRTGLFEFWSRYPGIHVALLHVWLSEAAFEACYSL